jgi:hypothetical protein
VGLTELESVTSCVSSRRSNQLSYKPLLKNLNPTLSPTAPKPESNWSPNSPFWSPDSPQ